MILVFVVCLFASGIPRDSYDEIMGSKGIGSQLCWNYTVSFTVKCLYSAIEMNLLRTHNFVLHTLTHHQILPEPLTGGLDSWWQFGSSGWYTILLVGLTSQIVSRLCCFGCSDNTRWFPSLREGDAVHWKSMYLFLKVIQKFQIFMKSHNFC